jgi:hypothetical protein
MAPATFRIIKIIIDHYHIADIKQIYKIKTISGPTESTEFNFTDPK